MDAGSAARSQPGNSGRATCDEPALLHAVDAVPHYQLHRAGRRNAVRHGGLRGAGNLRLADKSPVPERRPGARAECHRLRRRGEHDVRPRGHLVQPPHVTPDDILAPGRGSQAPRRGRSAHLSHRRQGPRPLSRGCGRFCGAAALEGYRPEALHHGVPSQLGSGDGYLGHRGERHPEARRRRWQPGRADDGTGDDAAGGPEPVHHAGKRGSPSGQVWVPVAASERAVPAGGSGRQLRECARRQRRHGPQRRWRYRHPGCLPHRRELSPTPLRFLRLARRIRLRGRCDSGDVLRRGWWNPLARVWHPGCSGVPARAGRQGSRTGR